MKYRKIWEKNYGPIPQDEFGRPYEIHHIDGNRKNNDLSNLMCVSIEDHYKIHIEKGEYSAACMIAERLNLSKQQLEELYRKSETAFKKGHAPWNKGKTKVYTEEQLSRIRETTKKSMKGMHAGSKNPMYGIPAPNRKKIETLDGKDIFESGRSAAKYYGVSPATIIHWIKIGKLLKYHA
jgi:hypothetical protein